MKIAVTFLIFFFTSAGHSQNAVNPADSNSTTISILKNQAIVRKEFYKQQSIEQKEFKNRQKTEMSELLTRHRSTRAKFLSEKHTPVERRDFFTNQRNEMLDLRQKQKDDARNFQNKIFRQAKEFNKKQKSEYKK